MEPKGPQVPWTEKGRIKGRVGPSSSVVCVFSISTQV